MHETIVCHCHIPKTGGSALNRRLLFARYGHDGVAQFYRYVFECAHRLPARHTSPVMRAFAAAGHVPVGYLDRVFPQAIYLSVVRAPVERTLSFLNFVLNTPGHKVHERLPDTLRGRAAEDPDAFVRAIFDEPRLAVVQSNVQTRLISGCARLGERPVDAEDLDRALFHATQPNVLIGDQAELEAFIEHLDGVLPPKLQHAKGLATGAKLEKRLPKLLSREMLSPGTLARVEQANALDLALYAKISGEPAQALARAA